MSLRFENGSEPGRGLDAVFASYRSACPGVDPSAGFMPELWKRIDARRGITSKLRIYARNLATAAATACLLIVALQFVPFSEPRTSVDSMSYVDVLGADAESEVVAFVSYMPPDDGGVQK
ncbi:MAG: hypothetical protein R2729_05695 [Bryobacteraceae bacterium]